MCSLFPLLYLLRSTSSEGGGIQQAFELFMDRAEVRISADTGNEVIITPFLFYNSSCLLGENTNLLVAIL